MGKIRIYSDVVGRLRRICDIHDEFSLVNLGEVKCSEDSYNIYCIRRNTGKYNPQRFPKLLLSAGIHGDEPAGVATILRIVENVKKYTELMGNTDLVVLPCNNPYGYERNIRENAQGLDLNQQFHNPDAVGEVSLITKIIGKIKFDLTMDFHEDIDSHAFYLWERKKTERKSIAKEIVQRVSQKYPINCQPQIEGFPNEQGVIELLEQTPKKGWTQGYYMYQHGTKHCLILETPTNAPLDDRVEMNLIALMTALSELRVLFSAPLVSVLDGHGRCRERPTVVNFKN